MPLSTHQLSVRIRRDSPVPLYHQVAEHLRALIDSGELAAGEQLPNEIELARRFALSRPTMRQALDELVRDGLISRRRGIGTVVTPQHFRRGAGLTSVFDDLLAAGRKPTTEVLALRLADGAHEVATAYGLAPGEQVLAIERLRRADGEPIVLMRNWLPARYAFLDADDLAATGLYHIMRDHGDAPVTARKSISACAATPRQARLLDVHRGEPLLRVRHVGYDASGRVLDVGDHLYRGGDHAVEVVVS